MTPTGLSQQQRPFIARIVVLYALLTLLVLAIPALVMQPRGESPHPTDRQVRSAQPVTNELGAVPIWSDRKPDHFDRF